MRYDSASCARVYPSHRGWAQYNFLSLTNETVKLNAGHGRGCEFACEIKDGTFNLQMTSCQPQPLFIRLYQSYLSHGEKIGEKITICIFFSIHLFSPNCFSHGEKNSPFAMQEQLSLKTYVFQVAEESD